MMENFEANNNHNSELVNDLLSHISPAAQDQIDHKMKMAAKIHAGLKAKGWKSLDLARKLNIKSPSLVSKWLSGTHNFTMDTLIDIQQVLGIRLLDVDIDATQRPVKVNVTVPVAPSPLKGALRNPLYDVVSQSAA